MELCYVHVIYISPTKQYQIALCFSGTEKTFSSCANIETLSQLKKLFEQKIELILD